MECKKFTPAEDQAILDFARRKSGSFKLTGNVLWQLAESINLTCHTWQSMRSRYMLLSSRPAAKRPRTGQPPRTRHPPTTGKLPTMPPLQRRLSFTTTSTAFYCCHQLDIHLHLHFHIRLYLYICFHLDHDICLHLHRPVIHIHIQSYFHVSQSTTTPTHNRRKHTDRQNKHARHGCRSPPLLSSSTLLDGGGRHPDDDTSTQTQTITFHLTSYIHTQ